MKKSINKELEEAMDESPKTTGEKAKINVLESHQTALAQSFAIDGWRYYMENLINIMVRDAVFNFKDIEELRFKQGKIAGLKELLSRSKTAYEEFNKINKIQSLEKKYEDSIQSQEIDEQGQDVQ